MQNVYLHDIVDINAILFMHYLNVVDKSCRYFLDYSILISFYSQILQCQLLLMFKQITCMLLLYSMS